jgi:hypothetical protein
MRKKPPSRVAVQRSSDNDPRQLRDPPPTPLARKLLAAKATFVEYSKHKKNPSAYGLKPWQGDQEDPSYCDEHAGFHKVDLARAPMLLKRGIEAGLFGHASKKGDPSRLWAVDDNGWIYEAQITNPGYAQYHAYPVQPTEVIARKVISRYADYALAQNDPVLDQSLKLARERYR